MALINSYYPLLDLNITQRGSISTSRHYLEISAQGYRGPDNLCVIRRGAYKSNIAIRYTKELKQIY